MLTVVFNINSRSRRQEYSILRVLNVSVTVHARYVTTVYNTRTKVPSFYEQIWQLTIFREQL